ncbi:MAG: hypothetical protein S4CHLAM45_06920 [Chlamydiales bacterium]|nr:hypothetical protein [Chlamydiales bacterium]MCH9620290.1 hypothetical protein [Chlamydiales bacterium]MCH9622799.1 hypothetical protein [Chlamydiales bacterium]
MKVYFARHGIVDRETSTLSPKGRSETECVASFLKSLDLNIKHIYTSDKARAKESAFILGSGLNIEPIEMQGLHPEDPIDPIIEQLEDQTLYVSHLPFMERMISQLVSQNSNEQLINCDPTTVISLEKISGRWMINWVLSPKVCR